MRHWLVESTMCLLAGLAFAAGASGATGTGGSASHAATPTGPASELPWAASASGAMPSDQPMAGTTQRKGPKPVERHVDINSASRKELMTLPGIGKDEAHRIVAQRPYLTKTELVSKGALPTGAFLSIKRLVVAFPSNIGAKQRPVAVTAAAPPGNGPKPP